MDEKKVYSREQLITKTLHLLNEGRNDFNCVQRETVKQILDALENVVVDCLREASPDTPEIETKPLYGLRITATYKPDRTITMYGQEQQAKAKISIKPKLSKHFGYAIINGR